MSEKLVKQLIRKPKNDALVKKCFRQINRNEKILDSFWISLFPSFANKCRRDIVKAKQQLKDEENRTFIEGKIVLTKININEIFSFDIHQDPGYPFLLMSFIRKLPNNNEYIHIVVLEDKGSLTEEEQFKVCRTYIDNLIEKESE